MEAMPARLAQFDLEVEPSKTALLRFGSHALLQTHERRDAPRTFSFLGFIHYVGRSRRGRFVVGRNSDGKRLGRKLKQLNERLRALRSQEGAILVPALEARASHRLDDGRLSEAALARPAETWTLAGTRPEVAVGTLRIDVAATHDGNPIFIEVAVTHLVDDAKRQALAGLGAACFEIVLDPSLHDSWTWDNLRQEVLECPGNRHWIFHPDLRALDEQARCEAMAKAFEKPVLAAAAPERIRLRLFTVPVHLVVRSWGLCFWWPYNERVNPMLKAIAKSFGGRWKGAPYRNWVIPLGARSALLDQLIGIGAVREG